MTKSDQIAVPAETRLAQADASDPAGSAWVSANAGSGKTYILARRVVRLLLGGVEPAQILCLTFTRAAAAGMTNRIFDILGNWAQLSQGALAQDLETLSGARPDRSELQRARTLFALALDTPGGLKIQTIHAFCEALLHRFPLEADLPGHFRVMDEDVERSVFESARAHVFANPSGPMDLASGEDPLTDAFDRLAAGASEFAISKALGELVAMRDRFTEWLDGSDGDPLGLLRKELGFHNDETPLSVLSDSLEESEMNLPTMVALARRAGESARATDIEFVRIHAEYCASDDPREKFQLRHALFLTQDEKPKRTPVTKAVKDSDPRFAPLLEREAEAVLVANERVKSISMLEMSDALFKVAAAILARYECLKSQGGLSDFDDLILAAANLLTRRDVRDWVRYKIDGTVAHVLIDEAQDTSPRQWQIVNALVEEFFAGAGAGATDRTVFAVGDEKQSIYSFQGADPGEFARQADRLRSRSKAAGKRFSPVNLHLSFRAAPELLEAVDRVFSDPENSRGLGVSPMVHTAFLPHPGEVRLIPVYEKKPCEKPSSWLAPPESTSGPGPAVELARRIAQTIHSWIGSQTRLESKDRPIHCGDILILVRRRDGFVNAVIREMKARGLAIAGADRLVLTEHIAVEDLIALGRFLLMPEDDLSLAAALKSPLFGFDDEALVKIAARREGKNLISHLHEMAADLDDEDPISLAVQRLRRWDEMALRLRPFEFYATILGTEGGKTAFVERLGNEVEDVLDSFLQTALHYERAGCLNLENFIATLCASPPEIRREVDMARDEIRILTVHAAKGLEAPVVFLVDPCTRAFDSHHRPSILDVGSGYLWQAKKADGIELTRAAMTEAARAAEEEYRRLLYVGMTRAAERLVVCGWCNGAKPDYLHWHGMIENTLGPEAESRDDETGKPCLVWTRSGHVPRKAPTREAVGNPTEIPDWLRPATREMTRTELAPSAAMVQPSARRDNGAGALSRLQGTAIHDLLQYLPRVAPDERAKAAEEYLAASYRDLPVEVRDELARQAFSVLDKGELAWLFGPDSRAEVEIAAQLEIQGRSIEVSGRIDRIVDDGHRIIIADFKSDRTIPGSAADIPPQYLLQMGLYRLALMDVYPGKELETVLVWTRAATFQRLAPSILEPAIANAVAGGMLSS